MSFAILHAALLISPCPLLPSLPVSSCQCWLPCFYAVEYNATRIMHSVLVELYYHIYSTKHPSDIDIIAWTFPGLVLVTCLSFVSVIYLYRSALHQQYCVNVSLRCPHRSPPPPLFQTSFLLLFPLPLSSSSLLNLALASISQPTSCFISSICDELPPYFLPAGTPHSLLFSTFSHSSLVITDLYCFLSNALFPEY